MFPLCRSPPNPQLVLVLVLCDGTCQLADASIKWCSTTAKGSATTVTTSYFKPLRVPTINGEQTGAPDNVHTKLSISELRKYFKFTSNNPVRIFTNHIVSIPAGGQMKFRGSVSNKCEIPFKSVSLNANE